MCSSYASRTLCMLGLAQGPKDYSRKLQKRLGAVLKKPGREQSPESCHTQRLSKLLSYRKLIFVDLITTSLHYKNGRACGARHARQLSYGGPGGHFHHSSLHLCHSTSTTPHSTSVTPLPAIPPPWLHPRHAPPPKYKACPPSA